MESGNEKKNNPVSEDIRARRKHAKQLKKLEKKSIREEEFLENLRKPKSTKVVLADTKFFEKILNEKNQNSAVSSFQLSNSYFPELSSTFSRKSASGKTKNESSGEVKPPEVNKKAVPEVVEPKEPIPAPSTSQHKKTKKNSPTVLNVADLVVSKPPKEKKNNFKQKMKVHRKLEKNKLCGNMLDSSNPKRFRGKHREIEKRTFTKLKLAIIRDRILSLKARENKSRVVEMDSEKFKLELDLYLSDLMKKLTLAKAKKSEKSIKPEEKTEIVSEIESREQRKQGLSRKAKIYRKYCDNKYLEDLDNAVHTLIKHIVFLRDRAHAMNPIKARARPRLVVGLREVKKHLKLHKLKMIIVAPDLEDQKTVYNVIEELKSCSYVQNVPCVFALNRRQLGYVSKKYVPVSAFGILNYDGLEDKFAVVKEKLKEAQDLMKASQPSSDVSNIPVNNSVTNECI